MNLKAVLAIAVNLLGVAVPAVALLVKFGSHTPVDPNNASHLIALGGAMLVSFLAGMIGSSLLRSSVKNPYLEVVEMVFELRKRERAERRKGERGQRREARATA